MCLTVLGTPIKVNKEEESGMCMATSLFAAATAQMRMGGNGTPILKIGVCHLSDMYGIFFGWVYPFRRKEYVRAQCLTVGRAGFRSRCNVSLASFFLTRRTRENITEVYNLPSQLM